MEISQKLFANIFMFIAIIPTTLSMYQKDESNCEKHPCS